MSDHRQNAVDPDTVNVTIERQHASGTWHPVFNTHRSYQLEEDDHADLKLQVARSSLEDKLAVLMTPDYPDNSGAVQTAVDRAYNAAYNQAHAIGTEIVAWSDARHSDELRQYQAEILKLLENGDCNQVIPTPYAPASDPAWSLAWPDITKTESGHDAVARHKSSRGLRDWRQHPETWRIIISYVIA